MNLYFKNKKSKNALNFWKSKCSILDWKKKPRRIVSYHSNKINWFSDGKINVYNECIIKNLKKKKIAIYTVSSSGIIDKYSYNDLHLLSNSFVLWLKEKKLTRKNNVLIHSSASIESALSMLSFARIGVHFSVVFEDLESDAIIARLKLLKAKFFFTRINHNFFKIKYRKLLLFIKKNKIKIIFFNDFFNKKILKKNTVLDLKYFSSNSDFFSLFTSGSTGDPKGVVHSYGNYLLYSKFTCQKQFGLNKNSVICTASDAGWINGHTYALFGPLSLGCTTVLLEKPFSILNKDILKKIILLKITVLYLPVTIIRMLKALYSRKKIKYKNSIQCLGSMGEPLAASTARWFSNFFNLKNKPVVNTYFQTETGGIITSAKHNQILPIGEHGSVGNVCSNFIKLNKLSSKKREIKILTPWPGCMKKLLNNINIWKNYWDSEGNFKLFDLATKKNKNIFIHGRIDDVINIRGHRIGSGEVESVVLRLPNIFETSAISVRSELEGSIFILFVVAKKKYNQKINKIINANFGSYAIPKKIIYVSELPKTKSGKILRRLLRDLYIENKILLKNLSTINNIKVVDKLKKEILLQK